MKKFLGEFVLPAIVLVAGVLAWRYYNDYENWDFGLGLAKDPVSLKNNAPNAGPPVPSSDSAYAAIDEHALKAPADAESSVATLAAYLIGPAKDDVQKVRAIFRWVAARIVYDTAAFFSGNLKHESAEDVLTNRRAVCAGYARLVRALCKEAKVEVATISGFARGLHLPGDENLKSNHAWNAVKLKGRWHLLDATWAAGVVDGKTKEFVKKFNEFYFLTPPDRFIYSHLPEKPEHQLLDAPVAKETFRRWPRVEAHLFSYGVEAKDIRALVDNKEFRGFVEVFSYSGPPVRLHKAPLSKHLKAGNAYEFRIEAPGCLGLALIHNGKWTHLPRAGDVYEGTLHVEPGKLQVSGKYAAEGNLFHTILEYAGE